MFVDYYAILEISLDANTEAIKAGYKMQALKWHPDRNPGVDTTERMQQINEAYLILKDTEARQRYNIEYQRYQMYQRQTSMSQAEEESQTDQHERQSQERNQRQKKYSESFEDNNYQVFDETLQNWMSNARKQAVDLAKQTIDDIVGMSKASGKAMADEALKGVSSFIVFSIIMVIIFKTCNH